VRPSITQQGRSYSGQI